jgi:hypothetical protein
MGLAWENWKLVDGTISVVVLRTEEGHDYTVSKVRTTSKTFKTDNGTHVGTRLEEIRKHFSSLTALGTFTSSNSKNVTLYDANSAGIAFEISDGSCVGIIVHESGKRLTPTPEERTDWKSLTANP